MEAVDIIQIDEDNRIVVEYDFGAEDPRNWGWGIELFEMDYRYGWEVPNPNHDPAVCMFNDVFDRTADVDKALRGMQIWMVLTGDKRIARFWDMHVQRDVTNFLVLGYDEYELFSFFEVYRQWAAGEVYVVSHEKRLEYVLKVGDDIILEDVHEEWEMVDCIGGCYLDHEHTAIEVARDFFDIDIREQK